MTHIAFDWDGTIAKKEIAEEANNRRSKTLGITIPLEKLREMQKTHAHYQIVRDAIENYTGVKDKQMQTVMMTNLFQIHYLSVVHEWKEKVFYPQMLDLLKQLHKENIALSIVTALRQDLVEPALNDLGIRNLFAGIYGNTPDLIHTKETIIKKAVEECGDVHLVVGDREEDMKAGKANNAKTAFATWGQGELTNKKLADVILKRPEDLMDFLKEL